MFIPQKKAESRKRDSYEAWVHVTSDQLADTVDADTKVSRFTEKLVSENSDSDITLMVNFIFKYIQYNWYVVMQGFCYMKPSMPGISMVKL